MTATIYTHDAINTEEFFNRISQGYATIRFNVVGYWSDVINVTVARNYFNAESDSNKWGIQVSHSSGGRDPKVVESDIVAERNLGMSLIAAADFAEQLTQRFEEFEAMYQARANAMRIERETALLARQKKIDDDAPIGMEAASNIMKTLDTTYALNMKAFNRGEDIVHVIMFSTNRRGRKVYRIGGKAKDREYILTYIAERSNRSTFQIAE